MDAISGDDVVLQTLASWNGELAKKFDGDVLILRAPMRQPVDDRVRLEIEGIRETGKRRRSRLVVIVETNGGYIETVERIVSVFRKHYKIVEFVVPNYAYSAGTILVLSGDEIHMDYYSVLGPIDPQYDSQGEYVPGLGYLAKYKELMDEINACDPSQIHQVQAQMSFLVNKFDPAKLFHIEQSIEHAKSLLKEWLPKYKFKDWKTTATNGKKVTKKMKDDRANEVAMILGNTERWHSHGRGISIRELGSEEIKLKVNNFGDDDELNGVVRAYYSLFVDYIQKIGMDAAMHSHRGLKRVA